MPRSYLFLMCAILSASVTFACGADDANDPKTTYSCNEEEELRCKKNEEYCLQTVESDGETKAAASCHPVPADCQECGCVEDDAPVTAACGEGFMTCLSLGASTYRVECIVPDEAQ